SSTVTYSDPNTGLEVRWEGMEYRDYETIEWTVFLNNHGESDTPIISNLQGLDTTIKRSGGEEFILHYNRGDNCSPTSYEPLTRELGSDTKLTLAPTGGRPTNFEFPYFNIRSATQSLITVVGWPGQWAATFESEGEDSLHLVAGQEKTHFVLHPGEEVRTPLIVLQFSEGGDWIDAQNNWRRWMIECNIPRPNGKPLKLPGFAACSSHQFAEMTKANEKNQIEFIDSYLKKGLKIDYWWMDAGWYVGAAENNWPFTGTWEVDRRPHRFPNGLRAVSDHAHAKGVDIIVWFEPERVAEGTWLATEHPEWILGEKGGLLNLGNPEAWDWLVNHIDGIITDEGIDLYRQDFNIDPLPHWQANDTPDRVGITENKYVVGYLAYWDELLRRHPGLRIDSCASGGRRNDLETLRRAVPLLRSDYLFEPVGQQCHTYGLSMWVPFYGTGYCPSNTVGWGWGTGGISYDPYTRRSNMCPSNIACFDFREPVDDQLIQKLYREWIEVAPNFFGDYYPLTEYSESNNDWIAWQFDRPEEGTGMIQAFRRTESPFFGGLFRLRGLDPDAEYKIVNMDADERETRTGKDLMDQGLEIVLEESPGSAVIEYWKK
ncbi:MAG: alpha-galactosidase, partial [Candidatus Omnitrophica bacterium]|nr:alpha-galactosidase [Candidatus Omnitrophota bacterium]